MELEERPKSLARLDEAIHACRRCPIGLLENQAEDEMKERQERLFHADLAAVAERMAELAA